MATFSENLQTALRENHLRQVDVINRVNEIGAADGIRIGKSHMSQYVSGKTVPRRDLLNALAAALSVDPDWLAGGDMPMHATESDETSMSASVADGPGTSPAPFSSEEADAFDGPEEKQKDTFMREFKKSSKLDDVLYDVRGPVVDAANRMSDAGIDILKLNIGNPAPFGFRAPDEVLQDFRRQAAGCEGYSDSKGLFSTRKAIMQYAQLKHIPNVQI